MSDTKYQLIREQCRACLNTITQIATDERKHITADDEDQPQATNSLLSPKLCRLFLNFTALDVRQEDDVFPKQVCQLCVTKLIEYDNFRKKALASTKILYHKLKNHLIENSGEYDGMEVDGIHTVNSFVKEEQTFSDCEIDPKEFCDVDIDDPDNNDEDFKIGIDDKNFNIDEHGEDVKDEDIGKHDKEDIDDHGNNDGFNVGIDENEMDDLYKQPNNSENIIDDCVRTNSPGLHSNFVVSPVFERDSENLDNQTNDTNSGDEYGSSAISQPEKTFSKKIINEILYCFTCEKQFRSQVSFAAHGMKVHHGIQRPYSCQKCFKTFTTNQLLKNHIRDKCGVNKKSTVLKDNIEYRIVKPRGKLSEVECSCACEICGLKLRNNHSLKTHMKRHKNIKNHQCPECGVYKTTGNELTVHMRVHAEDTEKFQCPQCPQMFTHKNAISRHVKATHEGVKNFSCSHCPKRFATHNAQICHESRTHGEGRNFICKTCYRSFTMEKTLIKHVKLHQKITCNLCPKRFMNLKTLAGHQKVHLGEYANICSICSHGFYNLHDLETHCKQHENDNCSNDRAEGQSAGSEATPVKNSGRKKKGSNAENNSISPEISGSNEANHDTDSGSQKRGRKKNEERAALRDEIKNTTTDTDHINNNLKNKNTKKSAGKRSEHSPESHSQQNIRKRRFSVRNNTRNRSPRKRPTD